MADAVVAHGFAEHHPRPEIGAAVPCEIRDECMAEEVNVGNLVGAESPRRKGGTGCRAGQEATLVPPGLRPEPDAGSAILGRQTSVTVSITDNIRPCASLANRPGLVAFDAADLARVASGPHLGLAGAGPFLQRGCHRRGL